MTRILCLGMSALDAIYTVPAIPTAPVKILATGFRESGGGMASNASVAVARLGGDAEYWAGSAPRAGRPDSGGARGGRRPCRRRAPNPGRRLALGRDSRSC